MKIFEKDDIVTIFGRDYKVIVCDDHLAVLGRMNYTPEGVSISYLKTVIYPNQRHLVGNIKGLERIIRQGRIVLDVYQYCLRDSQVVEISQEVIQPVEAIAW